MDFVGKNVRLLFDDLGRATSKQGLLLGLDSDFATIKTDKNVEMIPASRIIRIELLEDHDG